MRSPITGHALFMLNSPWQLRAYVLDEGTATRNIQHLHTEADCKYGQFPSLSRGDNQQIRFVFDWMDRTQLRMRFVAISQRVHVRIAAGQQDAVELCDYGIDVV